jgi:hypothetical protein
VQRHCEWRHNRISEYIDEVKSVFLHKGSDGFWRISDEGKQKDETCPKWTTEKFPVFGMFKTK